MKITADDKKVRDCQECPYIRAHKFSRALWWHKGKREFRCYWSKKRVLSIPQWPIPKTCPLPDYQEIPTHTKDSDCQPFIDPLTDTCIVCHVTHGEPCPECQQRGYHKPDCSLSDKE
jgi:hypothetical protein